MATGGSHTRQTASISRFVFLNVVLQLNTAPIWAQSPPTNPGETKSVSWQHAYLLSRAGAAFAKGDLEESKSLFESALALKPTDATALKHLAAIARKEGNDFRARSYLIDAVEAHPANYDLRFELAIVLIELKKTVQAIPHLQAATIIDPQATTAHVLMGNALSGLGKVAEATRHYRKAIDSDPKSAWAQQQLGFHLLSINEYEEAAVALGIAAQSFSNHGNIHLALGHAHSEMGNDTSALRAYQKAATLLPKSGEVRLHLGNTYARSGHHSKAQKSYEQAVRVDPSNATARVQLGILFQNRNQLDRAERHYQEALKSNPNHAWALTQLGFLKLSQKSHEQAYRLLNRAVKVAPGNVDVLLTLGDLHGQRKNYANAKRYYRTVLSKRPQHLAATIKTADIMRQEGQLQLALQWYRRAAKTHPKSSWALISLGECLRLLGQKEEAEAEYRAAIQVDPGSAWATRQLGYLLFEMQRLNEARTLLETSQQIFPEEGGLFLLLGHIAHTQADIPSAEAYYSKAYDLLGEDYQGAYFLAVVARNQGEIDRAVTLARKAVARAPQRIDTWILLGDALVARALPSGSSSGSGEAPETSLGERPDITEADRVYRKALQLDNTATWARRQLGFLAFALKRYDEAKLQLAASVRDFPEDPEIALTLGHIERRDGRHEPALEHYSKASALTPDDERPAIMKAITLRALGKDEEALEALTYHVAGNPASGWAWYELGVTQSLRLNLEDARTSARRSVALRPQAAEGWQFLAHMEHQHQNIDAAVQAYKRALELDPSSTDSEIALAATLLDRAHDSDLLRAQEIIEAVIHSQKDNAFAQLIAGHTYGALFRLAAQGIKLQTEQFSSHYAFGENARKHFERVLELQPHDLVMWLSAAHGLKNIDAYEESLRALQPLLSLDNSLCPDSEWELTWSMIDKGVDIPSLTQVNPELLRILNRSQLVAQAHLLAGEIHEAAADRKKARHHLACAIALEPHSSQSHVRLGWAYESENLRSPAEEHYLMALQIDPQSRYAQLGVERLRKEGGYFLGEGMRLSGETSFHSGSISSAVLARQSSIVKQNAQLPGAPPVLGDDEDLLTVPRRLRAAARFSYRHPKFSGLPSVQLGYAFDRYWNNFLSDRLQFENSLAHTLSLGLSDEAAARRFQGGQLGYKVRYDATLSNTENIEENRNRIALEGNISQVQLGSLVGELGYQRARFDGIAQGEDRHADHYEFALKLLPSLRRWRLIGSFSYRAKVINFNPSNRKIWQHELSAHTATRLDNVILSQTVSTMVTSDKDPQGSQSPTIVAYGVQGSAGYNWGRRAEARGRLGWMSTPQDNTFDYLSVGAEGLYRFFLSPRMAVTDTGLSVSFGYDLRVATFASRVDHMVSFRVGLAR